MKSFKLIYVLFLAFFFVKLVVALLFKSEGVSSVAIAGEKKNGKLKKIINKLRIQ